MRVTLCLDSGAYACWKKGDTIDVYKYIEYIKRNQDWIEHYVSLDTIPGEPGRNPTKAEVEQSAQKSYDYFRIMKDAGLSPIPIFHQGEEFEWLEQYLHDGETYIGVSPAEDMIGWRGPNPSIWLDQVFTRLTTEDGSPIVKTHGFGVMGMYLLTRYPWTSCDSTSWTQLPNFGKIIVPRYSSGNPQYLRDPIYVHVSEHTARSDSIWTSAKDKSKDQFGNLSRIEQDYVIDFVTNVCGLTMTGVRVCDNERRKAVITYWSKVAEAIGDNVKFRQRMKGLHHE